jgi:hypothetical protein
MSKQPSKVRPAVRASKRQPSIGLFDEVRIVRANRKLLLKEFNSQLAKMADILRKRKAARNK